jgi:hypothetical protein
MLIYAINIDDYDQQLTFLWFARTIGAFLHPLFFLRLSMFLSLSDKVSAHIDILFKIYQDISYFIIVMGISIVCLAASLCLIT